jgi:hypothetical protein
MKAVTSDLGAFEGIGNTFNKRWPLLSADSGHLCEICHDTEVVRRLMAQAIIVAGEKKTRTP